MEFGYPTEEEYAEAFGVETAPEGGEPGEGTAGPEPKEGAGESQKGTQEPGEEGEEGTGTQEGKPPVQDAETRHAQAAARRAREEVARRQAEQQRIDQVYANMFAGQVSPFTGKPITTEAAFQAYQQERTRRSQEEQLQRAGITPDAIRGIVDEQTAPMRRQMEAAQLQAARARAMEVQAKSQEAINASLKNISAIDPSIKTLEDIAAMPTAARFNELVQKGVGMEDAFYLANRQDIERRNAQAAATAARNSAGSRTHLNPVRTGSGELPVEVPRDQAEMFREIMPNATDAEIQSAYKRYLKEMGG